jgi:hypothetical protein
LTSAAIARILPLGHDVKTSAQRFRRQKTIPTTVEGAMPFADPIARRLP